MHRSYWRLALAGIIALGCVDRNVVGPELIPLRPAAVLSGSPIVINEVLADPNAVGDDRGEWIEVHNAGSAAVNLQGWTILSGNDGAHTISASLSVAAGGYAILAEDGSKAKNGGVVANYVYGTGLNLANTNDWVAIHDGTGAAADSVAWTSSIAGASRGVKDPVADNTDVNGGNWQTSTTVFGKGDKGTPGKVNDGYIAQPLPVTTVTVSPATSSVVVGATQQFTATGKDANGVVVSTTFTWTSSNSSVATVSSSGLATAVAAGTATITATSANGVAGTAVLTVTTGGGGGTAQELVVRVLDIGQGDANLITNGTSKVIIDGGPDPVRFGFLLDSLGLNNTTIDVVILSHEHQDHHSGLRELFKTSRNITIGYFFENKNVYSNIQLQELRDSINARVGRGTLIYRDSDDPCVNGAPLCTITMDGGAKLHVMRPNPAGTTPNNRSTPVKLVGPDSTSFSMWFAGDAEHEEIGWFDTGANYDVSPGMKVNVLKSDHHGSCNGVMNRYADLINPDYETMSVGATNTFGHVHNQTKTLWSARAKPWYRTDQNGTITFRSPGTVGGGYTVAIGKGVASMNGSPDATSAQTQCNPIP
ncbi:MAG: lamin tail domain-containing protein [Gemmatimonadaceae bacterium]|nr:lamin tail domain-containing protein [Gemmatimonadaceae bacterium]